jgi:hypothetical protein
MPIALIFAGDSTASIAHRCYKQWQVSPIRVHICPLLERQKSG